jgi:hypothetical protein
MDSTEDNQPAGTPIVKTLAAVVALVVVGGGAWYLGGSDLIKGSGQVLGANTGYQAVFLTNGQVYFGKLESADSSSLVLRDIYYLKVTQALQPAPVEGEQAAAQQPNIQLVKLGSELHGPEDAMYLQQDKVLFWENMKGDSKVVEAINKYQETKK